MSSSPRFAPDDEVRLISQPDRAGRVSAPAVYVQGEYWYSIYFGPGQRGRHPESDLESYSPTFDVQRLVQDGRFAGHEAFVKRITYLKLAQSLRSHIYALQASALIPEQLVLVRWKQRSSEPWAKRRGIRYIGCRLPSGTWTLLRRWVGEGLKLDDAIDPAILATHIVQSRQSGEKLRTPHPVGFAAMIAFLHTKGVLTKLLDRQRCPDNPGLPDLFLCRIDRDGRVLDGHFVEVKKRPLPPASREAVSTEQRAEIEFLRSLGLAARCSMSSSDDKENRRSCALLASLRNVLSRKQAGRHDKEK